MTERNKFTPKQEEWLQALESGEYRQDKDYLCIGGAYCCLGVATKRLEPDSVKLRDGSRVPSKAVWTGLCLRSEEGEFHHRAPDLARRRSLTGANDVGVTFKKTAAYIRKYPWAVFTNFDVPAEVLA